MAPNTATCPNAQCRHRQDSNPSLSEVYPEALTTQDRSNSDPSAAQSGAWLLQGRACPLPTTYQPGGIIASGIDPWTPESTAQLWKGTASSEKATALNPTDAFSHQPRNHHVMALADTWPAEQMGLTPPAHTLPGRLSAFSRLSSTQEPPLREHPNLKPKGSIKVKKNTPPSPSGATSAAAETSRSHACHTKADKLQKA